MEHIAEFMRSNPGGERFIRSLGVETRAANGELRDTADILSDLEKRFQSMPYYAAKVRAGMLGIDERTLQAMIRGTDEFSARYHEMAKRVGVDQQAAAASSHAFMVDLRDLLALVTLTADKIIIAIQPVAHKVITFLVDLDKATDGWSTGLLELAAVLGPLTLLMRPWIAALMEALGGLTGLAEGAGALGAALSGPVGWIIALVAAIAAVLLSSKKFRDGISAAFGDGLADVKESFSGLIEAFGELGEALQPILKVLGAALMWLRDRFVDAFGPVIMDIVRGSLHALAADLRLIADVVRIIADLLAGKWSKAWTDASKVAKDGMAFLRGVWQATHPGEPGNAAPAASPAAGAASTPARVASARTASGPGPAAPANTPSADVGAQVAAFFRRNGFSAAAAQGMTAGAWAESRLNPDAVNPTSGAYGIGQWLGARKAELFRRYGQHPSLAQQLEFMVWELTHTEQASGRALRASDNARGALETYVRNFMRPGVGGETSGDLARGAQYLAAQSGRPVLASSPAAMQVAVNQKTEISVNGSGDPQATARAVRAEQERVNGNLVRNARGAVR
jgi:hypothetical protein